MDTNWFESEEVDRRVESLINRWSLEDKVNLVSGKLVVDDSGQSPQLPDGLPELLLADGPAGLRIANPAINKGKATALPAPIALAATWNPELAQQYGNLIGEEAAATGHNVFLGPAVDIARSPLGGRTFESFGEDQNLQSRMVVPEINAIQSHDVLACIKHYLVNNQEFQRIGIDVHVDERTLREIYLPPFIAAVQVAHIGSAMGSYNRINGTFACENDFTLTKILRDELGFRGFVMSDFMGNQSTTQSVEAGLDWELGQKMWGGKLVQALEAGEVSIEVLDEMVRRILRPIIGLGLADRPRIQGLLQIEEHSTLAQKIAEQSIVLLKNENNVLPLVEAKIQSIAVIGPDADNVSAAGGGSAYVKPTREVSMLEGIRKRVGELISVEYAEGTDPVGPGALLPGPTAIPAGFFSQLTAEFWDNPDFSGEVCLAREEQNIEFNYGLHNLIQGQSVGSPKLLPKPAELTGRFSVRFAGELNILKSGIYQLSLTSLGTARFYINDQLVIDTANAESEPTLGNSLASVYLTQIHLDTGVDYSVRVDYANDVPEILPFNEGMLRLGWQPPEGVVSPELQSAVELAEKSDVAIVIAHTFETEDQDRPNLKLPSGQDELISVVAAANPNTVVILMNAGPVEVASWESNVPAILESWFAGQEQGSAIARVLFGDVNPSGRLPITFPRNLDDTPVSTPAQYPGLDGQVHYSEGLFVGYRGYDQLGLKPQYPFGFGLTYTTFEYNNLSIDIENSNGTPKIELKFEITNTGNRAGTEVAQVYIGLPSNLSAPPKRLVDWSQVLLKVGEKRRVSMIINAHSSEHPFSFWNIDTQSWEIVDGKYSVLVGASARDIRLSADFKIGKEM